MAIQFSPSIFSVSAQSAVSELLGRIVMRFMQTLSSTDVLAELAFRYQRERERERERERPMRK